MFNEKIDKLIHEPARLEIIDYLFVHKEVGASGLKDMLGLSWGNLSVHLHKLADGGYIRIIKKFIDRKPHTRIRLSAVGRRRYREYRRLMRKVLQ